MIHCYSAIVLTFVSLLSACVSGAEQTELRAPDIQAGAALVGELDFKVLPEASGMVVSQVNPRRLWFVNDQGNAADIIAVDTGTMTHKAIRVLGVKNRDWEELSYFSLDDKHWLLIADVGDNRSKRDNVKIIFVAEPDELPESGEVDGFEIRFEYPDGPRDVEAVAVDTSRDAIFLLSKRTKPPVLYSLPLRETLSHAKAAASATLLATRHGTVNTIPAPTALELKLFPKYGEFRNQPTAMDMSPDGRYVALMTYGESYLVEIPKDTTWIDALNGTLTPMRMPILAQPETIAFGPDNSVYVSTERERAPLLKYPSRLIEVP